jgi:hypothetical protein
MIAHVILAIFAASATVTLFTCILACSASSQLPRRSLVRSRWATQEPRPADEKPPHVAVAALADPQKRRLPAGRAFARHEAEPGREVARPPELSAVADRGQERRRGERTDAGNAHQPPRTIVPRGEALDLPGRLRDPLVDPREVLEELSQHPPHRRSEIVCLVGQHPRQIEPEDAGALADRRAVFEAEGAHLVDQTRPARDELIADAVERLQVDLFGGANLREAHRRPGHGFGDGFGVDGVVLLRLHVGLHELGGDDAGPVTHRLQLARQPLRAGARFHADQGARRALEERQQRLLPQLHALDHRAALVEADDVEHVLAEINAEDSGVPGRISNHSQSLLLCLDASR